LECRDRQGIDPIVLGMRSDELDKRDASAEIESNNYPKITTSNFEPRALAVEDFHIWSRKTNIVHRAPIGSLDQRSPATPRYLGLGVPLGVSGKHTPSYNSHGASTFPKREQCKRVPKNGRK
jgi:hypothetical protein